MLSRQFWRRRSPQASLRPISPEIGGTLSAARRTLSRSEQMSRIRSRDTKPEMLVRRALHAAGLRYRLHARDLPGRPDLIFRRARLAVFVHGCFWHQHPGCERARTPISRREYWIPKFEGNVLRDKRNVAALKASGWTVLVIWECETCNRGKIVTLVEHIKAVVASKGPGLIKQGVSVFFCQERR